MKALGNAQCGLKISILKVSISFHYINILYFFLIKYSIEFNDFTIQPLFFEQFYVKQNILDEI